jgi:hypothetical protein
MAVTFNDKRLTRRHRTNDIIQNASHLLILFFFWGGGVIKMKYASRTATHNNTAFQPHSPSSSLHVIRLNIIISEGMIRLLFILKQATKNIDNRKGGGVVAVEV